MAQLGRDHLVSRRKLKRCLAPADAAYGLIRARLEHAGKTIGGNDLLIAAQAIALGYSIVTDNDREFARIDGLARENWLR
jgi:tRNA(fMet)-specific endonuclease VapC